VVANLACRPCRRGRLKCESADQVRRSDVHEKGANRFCRLWQAPQPQREPRVKKDYPASDIRSQRRSQRLLPILQTDGPLSISSEDKNGSVACITHWVHSFRFSDTRLLRGPDQSPLPSWRLIGGHTLFGCCSPMECVRDWAISWVSASTSWSQTVIQRFLDLCDRD